MADIRQFKPLEQAPVWLVTIRDDYTAPEYEIDFLDKEDNGRRLVFIRARSWDEVERIREKIKKTIREPTEGSGKP